MLLDLALPIVLHLLSAVIWVGGMFFAHQVLRPVAVVQLEPPQRLALWAGVFARFFPWVWVAVALILLTGYWMIFGVFDGMAHVGKHVHIMHGLGLVMVAIYSYVYFIAYQGLKRAVAAQEWPKGKAFLDRIRTLVGINTTLGVIIIAVAAGGRYLV